MKIPVPSILKIETMHEPCGEMYLSRIMEKASLWAALRFLMVVGAVCLWFKLLGYSIKLHTFFRGDLDRELHDHPWPFWSLVIMGHYVEEVTPDEVDHLHHKVMREPGRPHLMENSPEGHLYIARNVGDLDFRPAKWRHRVKLPTGKYCVTLVFTKAKEREWGFWTKAGWVPWFRFIKRAQEEAEC